MLSILPVITEKSKLFKPIFNGMDRNSLLYSVDDTIISQTRCTYCKINGMSVSLMTLYT